MTKHAMWEPTNLGPEALERITQAFDDAWKQIENRVGRDAGQIDAVRTILAKAIFQVAGGQIDDVNVIKVEALKIAFRQLRWT